MPERDPERTSTSGHLRLAMLQEIYDDAINVAGLVWPTPGPGARQPLRARRAGA